MTPKHDYDVEGWLQFYSENPGYRRSVGADGDNGDGGADGGANDGGSGGSGGDGDDGGSDNGGGGGDENWRTAFAVGDDKRAAVLERFTEPKDLGEAFFAAQDRIRSGDLLKPLPEDATEDDVKAYREQQGIPLEPKAYLEELPDGLVIGEDDQPVMLDFATHMHEVNLTPDQMAHAIQWYNKLMEDTDAATHEQHETLKKETEEQLRDEWGNTEYRANMNLMNALIEANFGEQSEAFKNATLGDGTPLLSNPGLVKGLVAMQRVINPAGVIVDGGGDPNQSLDDEIAANIKMMSEDRAAWNADAARQKRHLQLLEARANRDKKGQAA